MLSNRWTIYSAKLGQFVIETWTISPKVGQSSIKPGQCPQIDGQSITKLGHFLKNLDNLSPKVGQSSIKPGQCSQIDGQSTTTR